MQSCAVVYAFLKAVVLSEGGGGQPFMGLLYVSSSFIVLWLPSQLYSSLASFSLLLS